VFLAIHDARARTVCLDPELPVGAAAPFHVAQHSGKLVTVKQQPTRTLHRHFRRLLDGDVADAESGRRWAYLFVGGLRPWRRLFMSLDRTFAFRLPMLAVNPGRLRFSLVLLKFFLILLGEFGFDSAYNLDDYIERGGFVAGRQPD